MSYSTKVQLIKRQNSEQWYINIPAALAQAMDFSKGEVVEWTIHDHAHLVLTRPHAPTPPLPLKKAKAPRA
jgi:antitoxin component of MazEF toxin-antitoxin module